MDLNILKATFLTKVRFCPEYIGNDRMLMEDFHKTLNDDMRMKISLGYVIAFSELFNVAKGFESDVPKVGDASFNKRKFEASSAPGKKAKSGVESVGSVKKRDREATLGHYSHDCTNPPASKITCFNFRKEGHQKFECPDLSLGEKSNDNTKRSEKATGPARGRNFTMTTDDARKSNEVVSGTFLVNSKPAKVLFDSGADRSYVSLKYAATLDWPVCHRDFPLQVEIADGRFSVANGVYKNCVIDFGTERFDIDLVPIILGEFDVLVGMDWLNHNRANLDCHEKFIKIANYIPAEYELPHYLLGQDDPADNEPFMRNWINRQKVANKYINWVYEEPYAKFMATWRFESNVDQEDYNDHECIHFCHQNQTYHLSLA
ncbi:uncharacterized protein [Rutidosis leptorrhynchoides]|uniref:uncharacterized protein n=1 Tax=Rutidosis leptorrhynchoides TaxID=125765 RepID=UPI003A99F0A7